MNTSIDAIFLKTIDESAIQNILITFGGFKNQIFKVLKLESHFSLVKDFNL